MATASGEGPVLSQPCGYRHEAVIPIDPSRRPGALPPSPVDHDHRRNRATRDIPTSDFPRWYQGALAQVATKATKAHLPALGPIVAPTTAMIGPGRKPTLACREIFANGPDRTGAGRSPCRRTRDASRTGQEDPSAALPGTNPDISPLTLGSLRPGAGSFPAEGGSFPAEHGSRKCQAWVFSGGARLSACQGWVFSGGTWLSECRASDSQVPCSVLSVPFAESGTLPQASTAAPG
jgi:hypothetical protein